MNVSIDRLSIGCISLDCEGNLQVLCPLGTCHTAVVDSVFQRLPSLSLPDGKHQNRLAKALSEASGFLESGARRSSLCHIVTMTTLAEITVPGCNVGSRVQIHTISPRQRIKMNFCEPLSGWHVSAQFEDNHCGAKTVLKKKIHELISTIRMGMDSGMLLRPSIVLEAGEGYEILTTLGKMQLSALRLGEMMSVRIKVRAVTSPTEYNCNHSLDIKDIKHGTQATNDDDLEMIIDQLHGMLEPAAANTKYCTLVSATLEYGHTSLSSTSITQRKNVCNVPSSLHHNPSHVRPKEPQYIPITTAPIKQRFQRRRGKKIAKQPRPYLQPHASPITYDHISNKENRRPAADPGQQKPREIAKRTILGDITSRH